MPRKRVHPNKTFNKIVEHGTPPRLDAKQRARLEKIAGLPRTVLPKIQKIAERHIFNSLYHPTRAETRAMLKILLKRVAALRDDFFEADMETQILILTVYSQYRHTDASNFRDTLNTLKKVMEIALETTTHAIHPGSVTKLTSWIRNAFQQFDNPFSLSKDSPAVETVSVISNMPRPTNLGSVRNAIWLEMGTKKRTRFKLEGTKERRRSVGTKERPRLKPDLH